MIVDDDNGDWLISSIERPVKLRWKEKGIRGNYESWEKNIELQSFVEWMKFPRLFLQVEDLLFECIPDWEMNDLKKYERIDGIDSLYKISVLMRLDVWRQRENYMEDKLINIQFLLIILKIRDVELEVELHDEDEYHLDEIDNRNRTWKTKPFQFVW